VCYRHGKKSKKGLGKAKVAPRIRSPKSRTLLNWYDQNHRILPWRALPGMTPDPYHVWLSEVMLQQTTVAAVGPYYQKFLRRWPTLQKLARASLDEVRQMWAGLGYYRRAQSLHECAKIICKDYNGYFPKTEAELLKLPGFGPYTAAAVTSIAFHRPANVVDGNVERVIARLFALHTPLPEAKAEIREKAAGLLPTDRFGDYAQALMDLGATICTPRNPKCGLCPWNQSCLARSLGLADQLPRRKKTIAKPVRRAIAFFLTNKNGEILLRQRPDKGLLGGMMEIPSTLWRADSMPAIASVLKEAPVKTQWVLLPGRIKHVFSHFELELAVATGSAKGAVRGKWVSPSKLEKEALPSVMRKVVRHALKLV